MQASEQGQIETSQAVGQYAVHPRCKVRLVRDPAEVDGGGQAVRVSERADGQGRADQIQQAEQREAGLVLMAVSAMIGSGFRLEGRGDEVEVDSPDAGPGRRTHVIGLEAAPQGANLHGRVAVAQVVHSLGLGPDWRF